MSDRRQARILALQALSQLEVLGLPFMDDLDGFLRDESPPEYVVSYARALVKDVQVNVDAIDAAIQNCSPQWELTRMASVDRNLLRSAVGELLHRTDVPPKVVINESVEIAKLFGSAESPAFINGVLDAVYKNQASTTAPPEHIPPEPVPNP